MADVFSKNLTEDERYKRYTIILISLATLYHLIIIGIIGLGDNEAYYWTWSKHLDLSYFDHPPMVAYIIALTTKLGGDTPFFVRIGNTMLFLITTILVYLLTVDIFKSRRAGFYSVVLTNILPLYYIVGLIIVPDGPLATLWILFLYLLYKTMKMDGESGGGKVKFWFWYVMGVVAGLALLSKYFAILLLPTTFIFLSSDKRVRGYLKSPHLYLAILIAAVIASPILFWNMEHGYPSMTFHIKTRHGGEGFEWENLGKMVGGQFVMTPILLYFLLASLYVAVKRGFWGNKDINYKFIALTSIPTLLFFYVVMCFTDDAEPHWPALGYVPLIVAASGLYPEYLKRWGKKRLYDFKLFRAVSGRDVDRGGILTAIRGWMKGTSTFKALVAVGVAFPIIFMAFFHIQMIYPLYRPEKSHYDVTNDLMGWDAVAPVVREIEGDMTVNGKKPFVLAYHYNVASQLGFALKDLENVICLSSKRKINQFNFWQNMDDLVGRDAIYVANDHYNDHPWERYEFERIDKKPKTVLFTRKGGYRAKETYIYKCYGFIGTKY
ncbi:MAG: glycosyltransferase family 39 protein [Deltaproteobacteria bacterium]|uniref:Glycosyltransferase family 39 protein n=1 Tax=Candidatus Zymogenus saltonus TaxID=2844893 RepID=A0A9D8KH42_9DELT|nr:glycosyltransferase family 39 protein [Candidatus Zymogenus saltonus]